MRKKKGRRGLRKLAGFIAAAVMLCGCAAQDAAGGEAGQSAPAQSPQQSEKEQLEAPEAELGFIEPQREYNVIAELPVEGGFAIVYEQQMDDEFNKRFSRDEIFWGLYAQLFDSEGKLVETIDFDRHNLSSIPTPVKRLEYKDGYIYFESIHELDNIPGRVYEQNRCFYLAINDEGIAAIDPSQPDGRYRIRSYDTIAEEDGVRLEMGSEYDEELGVDKTVLRLAGDEYGVSRITLDFMDVSLSRGLGDIIYGTDEFDESIYAESEMSPIYDVTVDIEAATSQVTVENGKITLKLDFAKGVYEEQRHYTDEMLHELLDTSPDGKTELWAADMRSYFEGPSGYDYVVKNEAGEITFLYYGSETAQLKFIGNDRVWLNSLGGMTVYDAKTGKPHQNQLGFDYGRTVNPFNPDDDGPERITVGIEVDQQNQLLLAAHRPNTFGSFSLPDGNGNQIHEFPVTLTLLDWEGRPLRDIGTGMKMAPFGKFVTYTLDVQCDGRNAKLSYVQAVEADGATVEYMAAGTAAEVS